MERKIYLSMIMMLFLSVSCSKSNDDNTGDPVFDAEYTPLKNIKEIDSKAWVYKGAKVGNRKFGAISDKSCMTKNILVFRQVSPDQINGIFDYFNYSLMGKGCKINYVSRLMIHRVTNGETWCTYRKLAEVPEDGSDISDGMPIEAFPEENPEENPDESDTSKKSNSISSDSKKSNADTDSKPSKVEIGFQAGYLRIEDKLSDFSGKEKVYLYFKRQ